MTKKRKTIYVVISFFVLLGVVAGIASIFSRKDESDNILETPLGYMDGVSPGTGEYFSKKETFTFAESDIGTISRINKESNGPSGKVTVISGLQQDGNIQDDSYFSYEKDETGNTYLQMGMGIGKQSSATVSFPNGYWKNSSLRTGEYIMEFDFKLDEEPTFNPNLSDRILCFIGFYTYIAPSSEQRYLHWAAHDADQEGCYLISPWGTTSNANINATALLKYGEWYNIRLVCKLDSESENAVTELYINDNLVETVNARISSVMTNNTIPQQSPCCLVFALMKNTPGTVLSIDNIYNQKVD